MGIETAGKVQDHYASDGIAGRILATLKDAEGKEASPVTPEVLAPLDHVHDRGIKATREIVGLLEPQPHNHLLDIGGGIGGPARWIAARFGCHITILNMNPNLCRAALELNALTGLFNHVQVVLASATDLPFPEDAFDGAYAQNATMNIADKKHLYAEVFRVLRPGGVFALSQYCAGSRDEPYYPLPWSAWPATSFLCSTNEAQTELIATGFELVWFHDRTKEIVADLRENRRRLEAEGLSLLGLQTLMGERIREPQINVARSTEEGRLSFIEALARKPAESNWVATQPTVRRGTAAEPYCSKVRDDGALRPITVAVAADEPGGEPMDEPVRMAALAAGASVGEPASLIGEEAAAEERPPPRPKARWAGRRLAVGPAPPRWRTAGKLRRGRLT